MWKPTLIVFIAFLVSFLEIFDPVISAPTISYQTSLIIQEPTPLVEPLTETKETKPKCAVCYEEEPSDICYFNCKPTKYVPKGHTICNDCLVKTAIRNQPCPHCRADLNENKFYQLLEKDPVSAWTFILEKLKLNQCDLTKPLNDFVSKRYTHKQLDDLITDIIHLVYTGASIYSKERQPIISKAIKLVQIIEKRMGVGSENTFDKRKILNEYFKHCHYDVVYEIIQSNSESDKIHIVDQLIESSFHYKNTTLLYDYMKDIATLQENKQFIQDVIHFAMNYCHLDGLVELIHTVFKNDQTYLKDLMVKLNEILLMTWTFHFDKLENEKVDLTKPINEIVSKTYIPKELENILEDLGDLLYFGAFIYSQQIQPIVTNAIDLFQWIQKQFKKSSKITLAKKRYINEYFKHGHYNVLNEIMKSNSESGRIDTLNYLIGYSFQNKNTTFIYDFMKKAALKEENLNMNLNIMGNVIDYAVDTCLLDGLLELVHTIFKNDKTLIEGLIVEVFKMTQSKHQKSRDDKCSLKSTKDYREYLTPEQISQL